MMDIHLELHGTRIWMANPYRGDIRTRATTIPGSDWAHGPKPTLWSRQVAGRRAKGVWTFPMNYRTCLDLRREFGDENLVIHPELEAWAREEKQTRLELSQILATKEMPTPRLEREYPDLAEAVHRRPYQSVGIAYTCRARRNIIGDEPGLGKTLQAAGAAVELGLTGPCLVLAPTSAASITWPDEFGEWVPKEPYWQIEGSKEQRIKLLDEFWDWSRDHPNRRAWAFANIEMMQRERKPSPRKMPEGFNPRIWADMEQERLDEWDPEARRYGRLFDEPFSAVFLDESHKVLPTHKSRAKEQSQVRSGAQRLLVRPHGLKVAMSGTPWRGNPLNNWGTLNWLYPEQYTGYWAYVDRWFYATEEVYNKEGDTGKIIHGIASESEKDFGVELDRVMIRRTKSEVAPDLPPKQYAGTHLIKGDKTSPIGIWIPMEGAQERAYQQMVADAMAALDSGTLLATGILAELTRCKQLACSLGDIEQEERRKSPKVIDEYLKQTGKMRHELTREETHEWVDVFHPNLPSNKWQWTVNWLEERGIAGASRFGDNKVVIASQYTTIINRFSAELVGLGVPILQLTGETSTRERRLAKATFQAPGGPRVFLLNTMAGGTSLTLDAADDMIFIDETWVPDDQTQVEDRIHRVSRTDHDATYWYLRSRGTIDERIAMRTAEKDNVQRKLMDGRRGIDYAKKLLGG